MQNNPTSICRACMQLATNLFGLETEIEEGGSYTLQDFFVFTTQLQIRRDDELPRYLCRECKNELQSFYQFVQKARKSDIMLREKGITLVKAETTVDLEQGEPLLPAVIEELKLEENEINLDELQTNDPGGTQEPQYDPIDTSAVRTRKSSRKSPRIKHDDFKNHEEIDFEDNNFKRVHFEEILLEDIPKLEAIEHEGEQSTDRRATSKRTNNFGTQKHSSKVFRQYPCSQCSKRFSTIQEQARHVGKFHKNIFMCKYCGMEFEMRHLQREHLSEHYDIAPFPCEQCDKKFFTRRCLNLHTQQIHLDRNPSDLPCTICGKGFKTEEQLQCHYAMHSGDKNHLCDFCEDSARSNPGKDDSKMGIENNQAEEFTIKEKLVAGSIDLKDESILHEDNNDIKKSSRKKKTESNKQYCCSQCSQEFVTLLDLSKHVGKFHKHIFMCKYCGLEFETRISQRAHLLEHDDIAPYPCERCDKKYFTRRCLTLHIWEAHSCRNPTDLPCTLCGKGFETKEQLQCHYAMHSGDKNHSCEFCRDDNVATMGSKNVRLEEPRHEDVKPSEAEISIPVKSVREAKKIFNCSQCPQKFSTLLELSKHVGKWHKNIIMCKYCGKEFETPYLRRLHLSDVHGDIAPYACDQCDGKYFTKNGMMLHKEQVHLQTNPSYRQCGICAQVFDTRQQLECHYPIHTGDKNHSCELCANSARSILDNDDTMESQDTDFEQPSLEQMPNAERIEQEASKHHQADIREMQSMSRRTKNAKTLFKCRLCPRHFSTLLELARHFGKWHKHILMCRFCGKEFESQQARRTHLLEHKDATPHQCKYCNKAYFSISGLRLHTNEVHLGLTTANFLCTVCGKGFANKQRLECHYAVHAEVKPFACEACDRRFTTVVSLKVHLRIHNNIRPYVCQTCNKGFTYNSSLKVHERIHRGEKPYKCTVCDRAFRQQHILRTHMTLHTGKTVKCPQCDKLFSCRGFMLIHLRNHTGERPYLCAECPQSFKKKNELDAHVISQHLGDNRPKYTCNVCSKEYLKKESLERHMYEHRGTKPFKCRECDKGFVRKYKYRKHLMDSHSIQLDDIEDK